MLLFTYNKEFAVKLLKRSPCMSVVAIALVGERVLLGNFL